MKKELLGLVADVNPAEITSHIAYGDFHEWCERWREVAQREVAKMNNQRYVTLRGDEDLVKRADLDCRGLAFLRHADGSDYTPYERGYNDAVISIYGMISSAPCAIETAELDSRLDELDAKIILTLAEVKMNVSEVGRRLFLHPNTVRYRIGKIQTIMGASPLNPYDLCKLCVMARRTLGGERND